MSPTNKVAPSDAKATTNGDSSVRSIPKAIHFERRGSIDDNSFATGCVKLFHTRIRFIIMVLILLCLASIWSNILSFNFAVICFIEPTYGDPLANQTAKDAHPDRSATQFTPREKSYLTSVVAATALVGNFAVVQLVNRFGIRTVFSAAGFISAIATFALPTAIYWGFWPTMVARAFQGLAFSANFPAIGAFTGKWTYYKQAGLFVSVLVAYVQLAPALTMPISGALCDSRWRWPSVFICHAVWTTLLFIIFALFYRNNPKKHPFVGEIEQKKISVGKSSLNKEVLRNIPYKDILKTASVWAVWIGAYGNFAAVNLMFLYSPTYMSRVLHFPVHQSGFSSAIPPLAQFCIKLLAGYTSDKVRFLNETNKLRLYNSVAFFGSAIFMTALAFFPTTMPYVCLMLFGISAGVLGFTTGGFFKAGPLVSKHYSHFVTGNISLGITITMLIVPFLVNGIAPDSTDVQWRWVWLITAGTLCITNLLFALMCSAQPAYWTHDEFSTANSSKHGFPGGNSVSSVSSVTSPKVQQYASP